MPRHGNKKQAQRTKGNLRPSSSSHAAELLTSAGTASTGFVGFGTTPKYVPASSTLDDMDTNLDPDFRLVLRKLTKRDATTKIKGLQEFGELCREKSEDTLKGVLPFWPRTYNKMAMDVDYRVREAAQQAMTTLVLRVRRNLAPYIRNLMGAWLLSQCDTYPTVSSAAVSSFADAFPPVKQTEALVYCKESVIEYMTDNLVTHSPQTLSDPKCTEADDMENKYNRVLTSSLLAIRKLVSSIPANQIESLKSQLTGLLDNQKFWKHGKSKVNMVKGAMYSMLTGILQSCTDIGENYINKISPFILHNLDESDPTICPHLWEAVLSLVNCTHTCWSHINIQKAFWPKLRKVLESGCHGNAVVIAPNILPLISKLPGDLFPDMNKFYEELFACFKAGLCTTSIVKSSSECNAYIKAYMECTHYVIIQNLDNDISAHVLLDQVLPLVLASLVESGSTLYKTPLFSMAGTLLSAVELSQKPNINQPVSEFWTSLRENIEAKLTSSKELAKGDNFEEKLTAFVKSLFYPTLEIKSKPGKVKFEVACDSDMKKGNNRFEIDTTKTLKRTEIGACAKNFVRNLVLTSFDVAHKDFSLCHLRMFAHLLECDSSDEVIGQVISSCHGDVETRSSSHYFVFEICIPWIQKVSEISETGAELSHLVHIVCIFLPSLDSLSVVQLLEKLYESCTDTRSQCILLEKLFFMVKTSPPVKEWLNSEQFGVKLVSHATAVCDRDIDSSWQVETTDILNMVSLVVGTRDGKNELLVKKDHVDRLLSVLLLPLRKLSEAVAVHNRAELAVNFVFKAAKCFFLQYSECIKTVSAKELILTLFQVSLTNQCNVSGELLHEVQQVWRIGLSYVIKNTGGLLNEDGLLLKIADIVYMTVNSEDVYSIEKISLAVRNVEYLLEMLWKELPQEENETNPVFVEYCNMILVKNNSQVPYKIYEYLCIKGEYSVLPKTRNDNPVSQILFTSLFNCEILKFIHGSISLDKSQQQQDGNSCLANVSHSQWSNNSLDVLLESFQGLAIVQNYINLNQAIMNVPSVAQAIDQLNEIIHSIVKHMTQDTRERLWKLGFTRMETETDFVLCSKILLSVLSSSQTEPFILQLGPVLDRSSVLSPSVVYLLVNIIKYMSNNDTLTLTEIMVARLLSLSVDKYVEIDGGLCLLNIIGDLVVCNLGDDLTDTVIGVIDQIIAWKEENDEYFIYSRDIFEVSRDTVMFNAAVCNCVKSIVHTRSGQLLDKHWDFIMCSLVSWIQSIEESQVKGFDDPLLQFYMVSVFNLLCEVSVCLRVKVGKVPGNYPENLASEWLEFFSESVFSIVIPMMKSIYNLCKTDTVMGSVQLLLMSVCNAAAQSPKEHILEHKLPPLLMIESSPLPDNLQSLLNHFCPLLLSSHRCVQMSAFHILYRVIDTLPQYDIEDKSFNAGATGGEEEESNNRRPPGKIMEIIDESSSVLNAVLSELPIDASQPISEMSQEYHYTLAYLLSWKLLLLFFKSAPAELRQEYASYLQDNGYVVQFVYNVFRLMPNHPGQMFQNVPDTDVIASGSCQEIQNVACALYQLILQTMPAMVRHWWMSLDRKTSAYVDTYTSKHVSHILCTSEIKSVQQTNVEIQDMTIKARPVTREVIAVYSLEEVTIEMVISLPQNYPLGNISVTSEKRVGVSGPQWEKWLLQLNIFLQHQNGNIVDGLQLWKKNIDKRFEGVDECMICFYVLHGTNFQLPRIACKTCKKKFHSSCLYKWFNTSHNCTCPLCRNVF
ncbi:listerin E3 ubiquitin protein ligase 1 [Mactra antiquata]